MILPYANASMATPLAPPARSLGSTIQDPPANCSISRMMPTFLPMHPYGPDYRCAMDPTARLGFAGTSRSSHQTWLGLTSLAYRQGYHPSHVRRFKRSASQIATD